MGRRGSIVDTVAATRRTRNVIAERPGPPARRVAMLGAHLDSVREGPGINDNGSGVASTLALAERLRDRRGLRFGFWGAEELGLYGSRGYVASLSGPERRRHRGLRQPRHGRLAQRRPLRLRRRVRCARRSSRRCARASSRSTRSTIGASSDHAPFEARRDLRRRRLLGLGRAQDRAPGRARTAAAPAGRSTPVTTAAATRSTASTRRCWAELADAAGRALVAIG